MANSGMPKYMDVTPRITNLDAYAADLNKVVSLVQAANKKISSQSAKFQPFQFDSAAVSKNLAGITSSFTTFWRGFDARNNVLTNFGQSLQQVGRSIRYFAFDFERLGRTLSVALTLPLVAAGTAIVKWGSEFEQALKKVQVLVAQSEETVQRWGNQILTTMAGLGQSPNELAKGLFFAASAFGELADQAPVMDILRASAAGATIGLGEMEDVTRLLTASMQAYESSNLSASEAMFVLVKTAQEGNFESSKLATSLGRVLGVSTALKVPFRDLVTYIAGITRIGEDPSRIVTSLNSALLKLLAPTSKANKLMEAYGFSTERLKQTIASPGGLIQLLNDMRRAMPGEAFAEIFTTRAVRTALVATESLANEMEEINSAMYRDEEKRQRELESLNKMTSRGITADWIDARKKQLQADVYYADLMEKLVIESTNTVAGQYKILKDTIQSIGIGAFNSVVQKPLLDFLKNLNTRLLEVNKQVAQNPKTIRLLFGIGAALAALGPGTIVLARLVQSLTVFTGILGASLRLVGNLAGTALNVLVKSFGFLGTAMLNIVRLGVPFVRVFSTAGVYAAQFAAYITKYTLVAVTQLSLAMTTLIARFVVWLNFTLAARAASITGMFASAAAWALRFSTAIGGVIATLGTMIGVSGAVVAGFGAIGLAVIAVAGAFTKIRDVVKPVVNKIGESFDAVKKEAPSWGEGLTEQYSIGILRGAAYVVRALTTIANIITGLLKPGSPPPILPQIDEWGKGTMEAWLSGWGKADFGILKDTMSTIRGYLLSVLAFNEDDHKEGIVAQMILGSRKSIIDAINEVNKSGQLAKETLQKIFDSLGTTTPALQGYIKAQFSVYAATQKLTSAQNALNRATKEYEDRLKPLNKRLSEINAKQEERARQQREEALNYLLTQEIPEDVRVAAQLELESIGLERQIANVELDRDTTLPVLEEQVQIAQENLDDAQKQLDYYEGLMDIQEQEASLLQDIADMLKKIKDAVEDVAEKLKKGLELGLPDDLDLGEGLVGDGLGLGDPSDIIGDWDKQLETLMGEVEGLKEAWGGVWDAVTERWNTFKTDTLDPMIKRFNDFKNDTLIPLGKQAVTSFGEISESWKTNLAIGLENLPTINWEEYGTNEEGETFPEYFKRIWDEAFGEWDASSVLEEISSYISGEFIPWLTQEALPAIVGAFNFIATLPLKFVVAMYGTIDSIKRFFGVIWETISGVSNSVFMFFHDTITKFGNFLVRSGQEWSDWKQTHWDPFWDGVSEKWQAFKDAVDEGVQSVLDWWGSLFGSFTTQSATFGGQLGGMKTGLTLLRIVFFNVKERITEYVDKLNEKFQEWHDKLIEVRDYIENTVKATMQGLYNKFDNIQTAVIAAKDAMNDFNERVKDYVSNIADGAKEKLGEFYQGFVDIGDYLQQTFIGLWDTILEKVSNALTKIGQAITDGLRLLGILRDTDDGTAGGQGSTTGGSTTPDDKTPEFFREAAFAEAATAYLPPQNYTTQSPFRNISPVGATGIASTLAQTAAHDESVRVHVSPGAVAALDGGVIVNFGDVHISNGMEMAQFEERVERVIINSLTR